MKLNPGCFSVWKTTTSPRSGRFDPYASRSTTTVSPVRMVGSIEPLGSVIEMVRWPAGAPLGRPPRGNAKKRRGTTTPATATRITRAVASRALRERRGVGRNEAGSRARISVHRSGGSTRSMSRMWELLLILLLQHLLQLLPGPVQMHGHRRAGRPGHRADLARGEARVVVENDRHPLPGREPAEGGDDGLGPLVQLVARILRPDVASALLELPCRDAERHPPDPLLRRADPMSSPKGLGERLGHRVAGDLVVPREGKERPPQALAM